MPIQIRRPTERTCERCGREERWDEDDETWHIDGDAGDVYCIHEWDINGSFVPFAEDDTEE
ncbi:HEWD family protein [Halobaculum sp. D14]|uniref:HEWD family protein n=1 Tax=unclassified Halobaculum TaxID=2640896 RepID=UPI003EB7D9D7